MSYHRSLGEEPGEPVAAQVPVTLELLAKQHAEILRLQREEAHAATVNRKWTIALGIAGALFAAVKLGFIAFPVIQSRRRQLGQLGL
jgi:hypothetical protein